MAIRVAKDENQSRVPHIASSVGRMFLCIAQLRPHANRPPQSLQTSQASLICSPPCYPAPFKYPTAATGFATPIVADETCPEHRAFERSSWALPILIAMESLSARRIPDTVLADFRASAMMAGVGPLNPKDQQRPLDGRVSQKACMDRMRARIDQASTKSRWRQQDTSLSSTSSSSSAFRRQAVNLQRQSTQQQPSSSSDAAKRPATLSYQHHAHQQSLDSSGTVIAIDDDADPLVHEDDGASADSYAYQRLLPSSANGPVHQQVEGAFALSDQLVMEYLRSPPDGSGRQPRSNIRVSGSSQSAIGATYGDHTQQQQPRQHNVDARTHGITAGTEHSLLGQQQQQGADAGGHEESAMPDHDEMMGFGAAMEEWAAQNLMQVRSSGDSSGSGGSGDGRLTGSGISSSLSSGVDLLLDPSSTTSSSLRDAGSGSLGMAMDLSSSDEEHPTSSRGQQNAGVRNNSSGNNDRDGRKRAFSDALEVILECAQATGFKSFDSMVLAYYSQKFEETAARTAAVNAATATVTGGPSLASTTAAAAVSMEKAAALANEQRLSRNRGLGRLVGSVFESSRTKGWSEWERYGFYEEMLNTTELMLVAEGEQARETLRAALGALLSSAQDQQHNATSSSSSVPLDRTHTNKMKQMIQHEVSCVPFSS
ncbi:uncharacterized protein B0I36DRAFT_353400 [Microdochium trichocladiopsis]|uniref:Uncharacterized protein n=1 Tax=Microdochium trichocladiopsis TaxID=1682393 RepID=A0A9P8XYR7_9PEZI|nr:uncharacterized protein B0I36DRAFT_353400 [Microdochium trichocladiopsis]KAH7025261.1 hypothetical protein B0I36DRAFT_353400 [Microdochium trichocladiopsis]